MKVTLMLQGAADKAAIQWVSHRPRRVDELTSSRLADLGAILKATHFGHAATMVIGSRNGTLYTPKIAQ